MTGRLTRCSQGHVFRAADLTACPVCGEELSPQAPSPSPLPPPSPSPLAAPSLLIWSSVAAIAAGAVLFFAFWPMSAPRKENAPAAQPTQEAVKPPQESATAPNSQNAPSAAPSDGVPPLPTSKSAAEAPPVDTAGHAQQSPPSAQPAAEPSAPSSTPAPPAQTPTAQSIPDVTPQLPKSPTVAPANTLLPNVVYPNDAVAKLQSALHLSDFLIDMLGEFAAADAMSTAPTPEAVAVLTKLADNGLGVAKFDLANVYFAGPIVGKDDGQGLLYLRQAADMGVGPARIKLAQILEEGQLVQQDHSTARELVTLAAREGTGGASTVAQQTGIDVSALGPTGPELTDMALQGNEKSVAIANEFIADHLASGYLALAWYGAKYSKDADLRRKVPEYARKAASLGISNGMNILANLYRDDALVDKNLTEAYLWITLAHRFCGQPDWCAAEEKLIAKLGKTIDKAQVEALRTAISQVVSPASDETK
jgi:TPR repeat protein